MKVVSTDALTKLIQLVKSAFISVDDTVQTSEVELATVATTGDYDDLTNKPTIPTVNNSTITFTQGGVSKGSFTLNQSTGATIELDAGGGGSSYTAGTGIDITNNTITAKIATSVSASSDNTQSVGAKLFYDTCGDIESLINAL